MKGFLASKKPRDDGDRSPTPLSDDQPKKSRGFLGKKKKQPEAAPQIDLAVALPSSDNFRTSLIMPGLSARFSMLKEADDPLSKLGKASDDSIINRRSRHFNTLGDIAEVSSTTSNPVRPPFAASTRTGSFQSDGGYATDDDSIHSGSIMSRARPGEGNMLFGGRQKIYRIPIGDAGSVNNLGGGESRGMRGRALYEDDVSMSAFQRLREREKQAAHEARLAAERDCDVDAVSPTASVYDEKRQTASSTTSGPSMASASTAATSLASNATSPAPYSPSLPSPTVGHAQGRSSMDKTLDRAKSRRLYEQGLDQHMQEQQSANLTRLNSVSRKPALAARPGPSLGQARSAINLRDRFERAAADGVSLNALPPLEGLTTFESLRKASAPQFSTARPRNNSNDGTSIFAQALDSRDRGKATALGTFNKPKQFDEQQFLERQKSLLRSRSERNLDSEFQQSADFRNRSGSGGSRPSAENSQRPSLENRFRKQGRPQSPALDNVNLPSPREQQASRLRSTSTAAEQTANDTSNEVLAGDSRQSSEDPSMYLSVMDDEQQLTSPKLSFERGDPADAPAPLRHAAPPPPLLEHPAMRKAEIPTSPPKQRRQGWAPGTLAPNFSAIEAQHTFQKPIIEAEKVVVVAPVTTDGVPQTDKGATLRGLVREHLRNRSDASSIYPSRESRANFDEGTEYDVRVPSMYSSQANPWDNDEYAVENYKLALERAAEQRRETRNTSSIQTIKPLPAEPVEPPVIMRVDRASPDHDIPDWQRELERQHTRAGSTETQAERDAFASELAQRQRAIQENLKIKADSSRSPSPSPLKHNVFENSLKPLGLLRTKSSRDSLTKTDSRPKRVGIGKFGNESSTSLSSHDRNPRDQIDGAKSPIGRTLHSRMPQTSEDLGHPSRDNSRQRQNSVASTTGRETSNSPAGTPAESSRTSTSREEQALDSAAILGSSIKASPDETARSRTFGYFEARNPQLQYNHYSPDAGDNNDFPFDNSGAIVEATRIRSNSSHQSPTRDTANRPPVPPLVTHHSDTARFMTASPMSESQITTPYSANSTPPLSSISTPSLRGENHDVSLSSQLAAYASRASDADVVSGQSQFHFPARTEGGHKKSGRNRGPTFTKADISEPRFISATSTVDTIPLPPGASLSNGMTSDVDVVLQASNRTAAQHNAAIAAAMLPFQQQSEGMIPDGSPPTSPGAGSGISSISVTRMPAPVPAPVIGGNSFRKGFLKFGNSKNKPDGDDDYVSRPSGGRLRIRKISNEDMEPGKPRHRIVGAAEMEQNGFI